MRLTRDEKIKAVENLQSKGGFFATLGKAWLLADNVNEERLLAAFPECITQNKAKLRLVYDGRYNHLLEGQAGRDS